MVIKKFHRRIWKWLSVCAVEIHREIDESLLVLDKFLFHIKKVLGFPAGLFRPGKSRDGPGMGQDRTGPRDLEGPMVLWSRD